MNQPSPPPITGQTIAPKPQPAMLYGKFALHPVFAHITATEAVEVRDMWVAEGVLPAAEATRRTCEVLFLIREASSGALAGVCTIYQEPLGATDRIYWHFRMFLRPTFRGSPGLGLPKFVLLASYRHLRKSSPPFAPEIRGLVIVAENPFLRTPRFQKSFTRLQPQWTFFGFDASGNDIFYCDFNL